MNFDLNKETLKINQVASDETTQILVDGDVIVPDIKPDILRVLQVDATSIVTDKEASDGKMFIKGTVNAKIFYVPVNSGDEPAGIKCINSSLSFNVEVSNKIITKGMKLTVLSDVEHVEYTVANERKVNIKAIVSLKTRTVKSSEIVVVTGINSDENSIEIKKAPINAYSIITNDEAEFIIKETFEIPTGKPAVSEMLKVDLKLGNQEIKIINNKIVLRGDALVSALYTGDTSTDIQYMEYQIPYSEVIDNEEIDENALCDITSYVKDIFYELEQDSDGDYRVLKIESLIGSFIDAGFISTYEIVSDCFSPGYDTHITEKTLNANEIVDNLKSQFTLKHIASIPEDFPQIESVYNVISKPSITDIRIDNRILNIEGTINTEVLYFTGNSESPISNYSFAAPFTQQIDAPNISSDVLPSGSVTIDSLSYNINLASEIEIRFILSTSTKITQINEIKYIEECDFMALETPVKSASITVYFAESGDSIWDIAKKYKVKTDDILKTNNLANDIQLKSGQQILIPRNSNKSA